MNETYENQKEDVAVVAAVRAAQALIEEDRARGLKALNELFRSGQVPEPMLNGCYAGELVALDIAPGLTQTAEAISTCWLPWQGKTFDANQARGDNVFTRDSLLLSRLFWPFYQGYVDDSPQTYRAFAFRTWVGSGVADPDRQVLKIDYDLPGNPRLNIRRVLDELMQVGDGFYLGKAHLRWWWGTWQTVAFFSLHA